MSVIGYRLRSHLRANWTSSAGVAIVVAVVCAFVLAITAGANRTATAADRYVEAFGGGFDAAITQTNGGAPVTEHVAALPSVERVEAFSFVFGGLFAGDQLHLENAVDSLVFSGSVAVSGSRLIEGRAPDPNHAAEFIGSYSFRETLGAELGDEFTLATYTQEQAAAGEFGVTEPRGPTFPAVVVGFSDGPAEIEDPTPMAFFSPALLSPAGQFGISLTIMAASFTPGSTLADLRAEADHLEVGELKVGVSLSIEQDSLISETLRPAVNALGTGLWLLALAGGIAAIAVLGQLVTRHLRSTGTDDDRLAAIGCTRFQVVAEYAGRAAVPVLAGVAIAVGLAVIPSAMFPTGFVGRLEPEPGIRFDAILVAGAGVLMLSILTWSIAAVALQQRRSWTTRPSATIEAMVSKGIGATAATGMRFAFMRGSGERGASRAAVVGIGLILAGMTAASVFGLSLHRLVTNPASYGSNFDYTFGDNGGNAIREGLVADLESHPDVEALTLFAYDDLRVGSKTVEVLGMEQVRGNGAPLISEGDLPRTADEVAFGLVTARSLGVGIGDSVTMSGSSATRELRVAGIAVMTGFGPNDGLGEGALMTFPALLELQEDASLSTITMTLGNKDAEAVARLADILRRGGPPDAVGDGGAFADSGSFRPAAIVNVDRVRAIPFVLAALLAALAVLSLVHVMLTSRRRRRRDFAVLSALGADRGWIRRAVHWQATVFTLVPLLAGIPLGVLGGRLVFIAFAESMGAVTSSSTPYLVLALVLAGSLLLANLSVALPARGGGEMIPAQLLQSR